jgi:hypothetical protein
MSEQSVMAPSSGPIRGESGMSSQTRTCFAVLQCSRFTLTPFHGLSLTTAAGGGLAPHSGVR